MPSSLETVSERITLGYYIPNFFTNQDNSQVMVQSLVYKRTSISNMRRQNFDKMGTQNCHIQQKMMTKLLLAAKQKLMNKK